MEAFAGQSAHDNLLLHMQQKVVMSVSSVPNKSEPSSQPLTDGCHLLLSDRSLVFLYPLFVNSGPAAIRRERAFKFVTPVVLILPAIWILTNVIPNHKY